MSGRTKPLRRKRVVAKATQIAVPDYVLRMHQVTDPAECTRIMVAVDMAYQRMLIGTAKVEHLEKVGTALNLAQVRCQKIANSEAVTARIAEALADLKEAEDRFHRTGAIALTGPGIARVADAIAEYETILRASTYREMQDAWTELGQIIEAMVAERDAA